VLAAAAVLLSNKLLHGNPPWTPSAVKHTQLMEPELKCCCDGLRTLLEQACNIRLQAVQKKFSQEKHHAVAKMDLKPLPPEPPLPAGPVPPIAGGSAKAAIAAPVSVRELPHAISSQEVPRGQQRRRARHSGPPRLPAAAPRVPEHTGNDLLAKHINDLGTVAGFAGFVMPHMAMAAMTDLSCRRP